MSLSGGNVNNQILSGQSTTWSQFGDQLTVSFAAPVSSPSGYSPDTSVARSGVSFESNLVSSIILPLGPL